MSSAFSHFSLPSKIITVLNELGYEEPTPVQEQSIPVMLEYRDLVAQAQTGTGKTAAFALPILSHIDVTLKETQALVIAPTRELAIQVAEAFQTYGKYLTGFTAVSIYGGQEYPTQLRALKKGPQVVVGTPGRLMDHMRRGTLSAQSLKTVILDEGDEMLKMGFVDDIEWILSQIQHEHQTALFSATMPLPIQKIANEFLKNPVKVEIKAKTNAVNAIEQCYTVVAKSQKLALLMRFLETEQVDGAIIFARTKNESSELAEKLQASGYSAAALNGDMNQVLRKKTIERIKDGSLNIVVATDVAARGIDVERITHVFNYDMPYDTDTYIHRIGRTGRAGRSGKSWIFLTPREKSLLRDIERAIGKPVQEIYPPSLDDIRQNRFNKRVNEIITIIEKASHKLARQDELIDAVQIKTGTDMKTIAAALAHFIQRSESINEDIKIDKVSLDEERPQRSSRSRARRSESRRSESRSDSRRSEPRRSESRSDSRRSDSKRSEPRSDSRRSDSKRSEPRSDSRRSDSKRSEPRSDSRRSDSKRSESRSDSRRFDSKRSDSDARRSESPLGSRSTKKDFADQPKAKRKPADKKRSSSHASPFEKTTRKPSKSQKRFR